MGAKSGVFVFIQIEMRDHGRTVLRRRILPKGGRKVRRRRKQKKPLPRGENITGVKKEPAQAKGITEKKEPSRPARPTLIAFGEPEGKKKANALQPAKGMTEEKRRTPALRMHGRSIGVSLWCEEESCAEGGCGFPPSVIVSIPPSCVEFMTQL